MGSKKTKPRRAGSQSGEVRIFAGFDMVWIPPGTFMMGSPESEPERGRDETQHRVTLTRGFWMGKYEVTQEQWKAVMGYNHSLCTGKDRLPVECVTWDECHEFLNRLNKSGDPMLRLPTEAEWEYACRAGTTTPFHFGKALSRDQANYESDDTKERFKKREVTTPVDKYPANAWGLHDMHGNVSEWCQDQYVIEYPTGAVTDPIGHGTEGCRVCRGGSWGRPPGRCRSAARGWFAQSDGWTSIGFRVVCAPH